MSRRNLILLVVLSAIWGSSFLFIKVGVRELSPSVVVLGRLVVGAGVLLPLAAFRDGLGPLRGRLGAVALLGLFNNALPFWLLGFAEERIDSGLTAVIQALVILVVGLVLMLWALGGLRNVAAPAAIGGPFQLTDQTGQTVTEKSMQGHPTLIFFGFTHCPDVCPTTLFEISEVLRAMGKDADRVNAYYISVDPERDTAAAMKEYLSSFDPRLRGLTGNADAVAKVLRAATEGLDS